MKTSLIVVLLLAAPTFAQQAAPRAPAHNPAPPDFSVAVQNLQHQLDDVTKDLKLDMAALQNLVEFQSYLSHAQQANQLQQQLNNLKAQQAANPGATAPK